MTREEKVRKAISVLIDCAEAAKGTEFSDYYLMGADALRQQDVTDKDVGKMTNAQKIRAMSDEELAEFLYQVGYDNGWGLEEYVLEWLQMPAEEDKHEAD